MLYIFFPSLKRQMKYESPSSLCVLSYFKTELFHFPHFFSLSVSVSVYHSVSLCLSLGLTKLKVMA